MPQAKNLMWAFSIFFGMTIGIGKESVGSDIVRYMADVNVLHGLDFNFSTAWDYFKSTGEIDVLRTLLSILVSRFTDNGYYLVIVFGFIFGYFYSRNMWFVLNRMEGKLKWITVLLLFCFFIITPIWKIGGFRFHTAVHVFLYGLLPYLFMGNKKRLIWCFLTPFVFHYSFLIPLFCLLVYLLLGNRLKMYYWFFIVSLFVGQLNLDRLNPIIEKYLPSVLNERSSSYRDTQKVAYYRSDDYSQEKVWYAKFHKNFLNWPISVFLIVLYWKSREIFETDRNLLRLLSFTFLFYGVAFVMSSIPSGQRFLAPAGLLTISLLVVYIQNSKQEVLMDKMIVFAYPFLAIYLLVSLREAFYYTSLTTVLGNPVFALFTIGDNFSINDLIK
ncbi:MAG: hypothetical protein Q8K02_14300 [Flavobacterium sp.]|nr:hypothetical protein [Flavobacterium sp.]